MGWIRRGGCVATPLVTRTRTLAHCPPPAPHRSEGYPRANNTEAAPVRGKTLAAARAGCAAWHRVACQPSSVLHKIPLTLSWTRNDGGACRGSPRSEFGARRGRGARR